VKFNVKVQGVDNVINNFWLRGTKARMAADKVTETYTRKMANESGKMAPVDTGDLRASIIASPEKLDDALWQYGSDLPYANIQEYEHATKKGFIRKSVWNNRTPYREALRREVAKFK